VSASADRSFRALAASDVRAWLAIWATETLPAGRRGRSTALRRALTYARYVWTFPGLRATLLYRASSVLHRRGVKLLPTLLWNLNLALHGLDIPPAVPIGEGLYIPHPVGTVVTAARIGRGVTLVSGVTIGMRHTPVFPTIGDGVYVGAGARVLGAITVGDRARIGANAVVLQDVPPGAAAVGVPARIVAHDAAMPATQAEQA
jgi:serine O-acetyltransferase